MLSLRQLAIFTLTVGAIPRLKFHSTPCAKLEGGLYTSGSNPSSNTCRIGQFQEQFKIKNRRYIIDKKVNTVDIFNNFPWINKINPNGTASSINLVRGAWGFDQVYP